MKCGVALDYRNINDAWTEAIEPLSGQADFFKVGKQLFTSGGPRVCGIAASRGAEVFLDLKFHDIPNTVSEAIKVAMDLPGVTLINVHASGGRAMMEAAALARDDHGGPAKVIAVTILTSMDKEALEDMLLSPFGDEPSVSMLVRRMARVTHDSGLDGVVCSAQEAEVVRATQSNVPLWVDEGEDFLIVTPAIRPIWSVANDQKRPTTPRDAQKAGATHLVLGRAVTQPPDGLTPIQAMARVREELG